MSKRPREQDYEDEEEEEEEEEEEDESEEGAADDDDEESIDNEVEFGPQVYSTPTRFFEFVSELLLIWALNQFELMPVFFTDTEEFADFTSIHQFFQEVEEELPPAYLNAAHAFLRDHPGLAKPVRGLIEQIITKGFSKYIRMIQTHQPYEGKQSGRGGPPNAPRPQPSLRLPMNTPNSANNNNSNTGRFTNGAPAAPIPIEPTRNPKSAYYEPVTRFTPHGGEIPLRYVSRVNEIQATQEIDEEAFRKSPEYEEESPPVPQQPQQAKPAPEPAVASGFDLSNDLKK